MSLWLIVIIIIFLILLLYFVYNLFMGSGSIYMKGLWLVLIVGLGIGFYYIYKTYFSSKTTLVSTVYLKGAEPVVIKNEEFKEPLSANTSYGIWIYVNSWNSNGEKTVFKTSDSEFELKFDTIQFRLFCNVKMGCEGTINTEKITITDEFPLQKWTYVIVSMNGAYVDCFLDGKLITSHKLSKTDTNMTCANKKWNIIMGQDFDAYAYNLVRYTYSMTPEKAYSTFYSTAPSSSGTGLLSGMNINLAIIKNDDKCNATTIL